MKKTSMNLTEGNITRQLIVFMLPILVGQIFQNLYNSVDSIVVGNAVGTTALAAVSASADISHLLTGFFTGFSTGGGVLISRCFGARDEEKMKKALHTLISFSIIIGVGIAAIGILLTPVLLKVVECPDDVFMEASEYLRIYLIGVLFTAIYNVGSAILRAVGDSKRPFYFLIISSIVNIILDILLVVVLKMGVAGAAWATIIAQALSVILVYTKLLRTNDIYRLVPAELRHMDGGILKEIINLGFPAAIQASLVSISNLFVTRYINTFGSSAMAGIGAAKKIDRFVGMAGQSLGLAASTFVSQNVGAKKIGRAYKGIRVCLIVCAAYMLTVGIVVYSCSNFFIRLFTPDEAAIAYGISMVHIMMPCYYFQMANQIFSNAVRGFGKSFVVMLCSIFGMIGCRQLFLFISMHINYRVENIYIGYPVGWAFAALFVMIYYFVVIKKKYKAEKEA